MSLRVCQIYFDILTEMGENVKLLSLEGKEVWERGAPMRQLEEEYLLPAEKFIFVMPEYNASFPGIVKVMMDNTDIRKRVWSDKKALLIGISDGRAGNLRGIEHMTSILHYLKVHVHYNKMLLSRIKEEMDKGGNLLKEDTAKNIRQQIADFIKF